MADRMAAEIWIGGKITPELAKPLCEAICQHGPSLEWGGARFTPECAEDLQGAVQDEGRHQGRLWLCDDEARWGEFPELEAFLSKSAVPFRRFTEGRYEYDPEPAEFRPDLGWETVRRQPTNEDGELVVPISYLRPVLAMLAEANAAADHAGCRALLEKAQAELSRHVPEELPPLPPFEITVEVNA